jgi:hypothetical protein
MMIVGGLFNNSVLFYAGYKDKIFGQYFDG